MFERLDWEDKNFIFNSGSYIIFVVGISVFLMFKKFVNWLCTRCWKRELARKLGVMVH